MTGSTSYVDWYKTGRLAPYLCEARLAGDGVAMMLARQPAGDMSDPPVGELVITQLRNTARGLVDLGAGRFAAPPRNGAFCVVAPDVATSILIDDPNEIRNLAIPRAVANRWLGRDADEALDFGPLHARFSEDAFAAQTFESLWRSLSHDGEAGRLFVETASAALLARLALLAERPRDGFARGGLAPWQVRRATEYIVDNLARTVSLEELAALVDLSPFHFARAFRVSVGDPPHRWQIRRRVERASALLRESDLSITDVAAAVGYETPQSFNRAFRKEMGETPSAYRAASRV